MVSWTTKIIIVVRTIRYALYLPRVIIYKDFASSFPLSNTFSVSAEGEVWTIKCHLN